MTQQHLRRRDVVTCFLEHEGRVLVLRRSGQVRTHQGRWAGVSGYLEAATPLEQAYRELREEVGLGPDDVELVAQGEPLDIPDPSNSTLWRVHPFRFLLRDPRKVRLDWEHTESRWVRPEEIATLETVPRLDETWQRVAARSRSE